MCKGEGALTLLSAVLPIGLSHFMLRIIGMPEIK